MLAGLYIIALILAHWWSKFDKFNNNKMHRRDDWKQIMNCAKCCLVESKWWPT